MVQIHPTVAKPGLDKGDRFLVAIDPPKLTRWVFKVHILSVDAVRLLVWKALVVVFKDLENIHEKNGAKGAGEAGGAEEDKIAKGNGGAEKEF